jgi:hypothetical protein
VPEGAGPGDPACPQPECSPLSPKGRISRLIQAREWVARERLGQFCHKEGLKTGTSGADYSCMAVPAITARPSEVPRETHQRWDDVLVAKLGTGALLKLCGFFFAVWMAGNWIGGLPTSIKGIHAVGGAIGIAGCTLFILCSYATVRAWQVRHRRSQ